MKKRIAVVLSAAMVFSAVFANTTIAAQTDKIGLKERINKAASQRGQSIFVSWDEGKNIPRFISGELGEDKVLDKNEAAAFLNENKDAFNVGNGLFKIKSYEEDKELGTKHYKTQMTVDGIPVYGAELIVHTDRDGKVYAVNGQAEPGIEYKSYKESIKLKDSEAIKKAEAAIDVPIGYDSYTAVPKANLYLYNVKGQWKVAYEVVLQFVKPYPANWSIFIDSVTGKVLDKLNQVTCETGSGIGTLGDRKTINITNQSGRYALIDTTRTARVETYNGNYTSSLPGTIFTDTDTVFDSAVQRAAVDAHYYAGIVLDYYRNKHARNSFDNRGATVRSTVHHQRNYNNAFWNGSQMAYGDGDGTTFGPFSGALDVVAHELTHAVTTYSANLIYQNQSGALNESFSDVFGVLIEGDPNDWDCGEDIYTPGRPGDALRSLRQPSLYRQPEHMRNFVNTTSDNGGVHTNSGIPNKAFYNIASNIGFEKSGKIYYRALTQYLTSSAQFMDCRNALMQCAADLYGQGSNEYYIVQKGFADVGIGSAPNGPTPTIKPTTPPTSQPTPSVKPTTQPTVKPTSTPTTPPTGDAWKPYTNYSVGAQVTYNGRVYVCVIAHQSLPGWEPSNVPALWRLK
ncbi:MAG: M4 family metallopeptidase [Clostridia bacterium]|nr:M4 family metallopeptidase [Clostridia bacterium]